MGDLLPAALSQPRPEWGHSAWEVFADSFVKFSLGPVLVNSLLAERAAALKLREVIAWEEPANPSWWSGRQMVAETARDIAEATGARLTVRAGPLRRAAMQVARAPATCAQARLRFLRRIAGPAQRAAGRSDVVFTIVSATLTPIFERVGQLLAEQHGLRVLGLEVPLTHFARGIGGQLLPKANLHAYATPGMLARANLEVFSSWTWQAHFRRAFAGFEGLAQLGRGVRAVLVRRMHNALIRDLPLAMYYSRLWSRFLDAVQPAAVVSFNNYNETIAPGVLQANARGLATLCCQEGVWGPYQLAAAVSPYDDLLVFGEYAAEIMQQVAAPRTRFTVTGHSLYDYTTWAPAAPAASSGGDRQAGGSHRPQVLATTQPIDERFVRAEPCWWVEALADACAELGARLLIKPHPQEVDLHLHSAVARRLPDVVTIVPHGERPLDQLIADCDALVTRF